MTESRFQTTANTLASCGGDQGGGAGARGQQRRHKALPWTPTAPLSQKSWGWMKVNGLLVPSEPRSL